MQEVEQCEEQADGYPTHMSGQEQYDMEPERPGDDTNSELSQGLISSDSGKTSLSLIRSAFIHGITTETEIPVF